jgi:hypothetical protein
MVARMDVPDRAVSRDRLCHLINGRETSSDDNYAGRDVAFALEQGRSRY